MEQQTDNTSDIEKSIARYNFLTTFLSVIATFIAVFCAILTIQVSMLFLLGFVVVVAVIIVIHIISAKRKKLKYLLQVRNDWGKRQIIKERDFKTIRPLFDYSSERNKNKDYIDEQTWKDLNMDQLYGKIDRTYTDPGEAVLYRILREPIFDKEKLAERSRVINCLQINPVAREKIQLALIRLGHQFIHNNIFTLLLSR